ncbi:hypothetical protein BLNAU_11729 [Blattamonas nauphoetae]|uniref:Protein kinase domain-containing protein n=1 Tax=Blattamonas nauphoetae TaxID=2049346 RepID=A0ABQ9XMI9_9EUKA|nr:hypothetical protein BLNAU_11729 [Blattamonas nauphoetae]
MNYLVPDQQHPRGEICHRGPTMFLGFVNDEASTKKTIGEDGNRSIYDDHFNCAFPIPSLDGCYGYGSQVQIIRSSHQSTSNVVLPLLGISQHARRTDLGTQMMNGITTGNSTFEHLSICGVGLLMSNSHFVVGTGPLFWFDSDDVLSRGMSVETSLVSSSLLNVSSSSPFTPTKPKFGSEVAQLVVASCVSCCTNHDSGTGMMSPNMGGNVVCLNTSFSSCVRQGNEHLTYSFENRTQTSDPGRFALANTSDVTHISFTLCTFSEMASNDSNYYGGSAINLETTSSSLTINTCFFHKCSSASDYIVSGGGAVFFFSHRSDPQPFSISSSSFTECSTTGDGGSLFVGEASPTSIDSCFFEQSTAEVGGALRISCVGVISISNCAFVGCSASWIGGAIIFGEIPSLSLSFVQFRECSTQQIDGYCRGNDISFVQSRHTEITADMFECCDSTSDSPNVYIYIDNRYVSTLFPHITSTPTIKSVDVSFDGSVATVTVETEEALRGTMGVLLDGSNVPRLVHVVFGKPWEESRIGTAVVSSGANGILPDDTTYTNRTCSFGSTFFPIPTVWTADTTSKDWNTTEIVLRGVSLEEWSYWMLVGKEETAWNITLTRTDSTTLTGTASLSSSNAEVCLDWSTEYEVRRMVWMEADGLTEKDVKLPLPITFTTPAQTTPPFSSLTGVSAHIIKADPQFAVLLLHFDREVCGSYDFVVEERGKDVTFSVVVELAGTTGETEEFVVVGDERVLTDYTTYTIKSLVATPGSSSTPVVMNDPVSFHIPKSSFVPPLEPENPEKKALSKEMKKLLSWLIPLVASLLIVLIAVIVLVLLLRRRLVKSQANLKEMENMNTVDQPQLEDEKVEIVTDNQIGVMSVQPCASSESKSETKQKEEPEPSDEMTDFVNLEEVLPCCGDMKTTVCVSKNRTLFNALHSENRWDVRERQAQLQLVRGLKGVLKKDRKAAILRALTSHNILFDSNQNVCLKLNSDITPPAPLPTLNTSQSEQQTPQPEQPEQQQTEETNESNHVVGQSAEKVNEGVRWSAPEVIENQPQMNSGHGAVFSLGLILWEMETGCVPFGEQDAVNASRQIVIGVTPKLESVENSEMRELISECLSLIPEDRPDFDTIESTLAQIPADKPIYQKAVLES